jgi:lipoprotein-releasing system permease protein
MQEQMNPEDGTSGSGPAHASPEGGHAGPNAHGRGDTAEGPQIEPSGGRADSGESAGDAESARPPAPLPAGTAAREIAAGKADSSRALNPFDAHRPAGDAADGEGRRFDPAAEQHTGVVLGIALASFRTPEGEDRFLVLPGDDVKLTFPTAGTPPKAISDDFTVVDFYESKMSEYDSSFVFVPIRKLQELRGMVDPESGVGLVSSIQIKLKPGADGAEVRDKLRAAFAPTLYHVDTWRDKQGPLLAAVQMETAILNVLLFLIIAVAGFGILAIFFMIVVEKTRDIGVLKALGAPGRGIMGIFLGYGLSLGLVGSGAGLVLGLLFVRYINEIAALLGAITGRPVFDPSIYYFFEIPTIVEPSTIAWIVCGALLIAVMAAILPARRAARLHPVEALRYE